MGAKESKPCESTKIQLDNQGRLSVAEFIKLVPLQMTSTPVEKKEAIKFIKKWLNGYIDYSHKHDSNSSLDFGGKINLSSTKNKYYLCKSNFDCLSKDIKSLEALTVNLGDAKQLIYIIQNGKIYYPLVLEQSESIPTTNSNKKCKKMKTLSFDD